MSEESANSVQTLILDSLKRIEQDIRELRADNRELVRETKSELTSFASKLQRLELELAVFKAKAFAWGGAAGVVSGALVTGVIQRIIN